MSSFWEREFAVCHRQSILPAAEEIIGLVLKRGTPYLPVLSSPFVSHIVSASHLGKALLGWLVSFFAERRGSLVKTNSPTGPQDWCLIEVPKWIQLLESGTLGSCSGWCCIGELTAFVKPRPGLPQCHCTIATRLSAICQCQL